MLISWSFDPFTDPYELSIRASSQLLFLLSHLGIQSHFPQLGVQSHFFQFQMFRATLHNFRHSKPPIFLYQAFKAIHFQFKTSKPTSSIRRLELPSTVQVFRATFHSFRCSKPPTFLSQVFIATHFQFRHSEPSSSAQAFRATFLNQALRASFLTQAFKNTFVSVGVQSRHLHIRRSKPFLLKPLYSVPPLSIQAFRATLLSLGIQSHLYQFRHSEPLGVQSYQAFRAALLSFIFINLGVHSQLAQFHFLSQAFKANVSDRCLEPQAFKAISLQSHFSCLGVQSHSLSIFQTFRATITSLTQAFRAIIFLYRRSQPPPLSHQHSEPSFSQAFRAIFLLQALRAIGIQSHHLR